MKDLKHYLALIAILSIGLALFWFFNYNRRAQIGIILAIAGAYVLWGVIHHTIKKDFHWRIILEYVVIAFAASLIIIFLLARA